MILLGNFFGFKWKGKGSCAAIAREGALKLKELTYIHAEAFCAGELKHGPLAMIDSENPLSTCVRLFFT
jgi:glucosamine--fructose-6-phosphate aminotransferase (isomerizing)